MILLILHGFSCCFYQLSLSITSISIRTSASVHRNLLKPSLPPSQLGCDLPIAVCLQHAALLVPVVPQHKKFIHGYHYHAILFNNLQCVLRVTWMTVCTMSLYKKSHASCMSVDSMKPISQRDKLFRWPLSLSSATQKISSYSETIAIQHNVKSKERVSSTIMEWTNSRHPFLFPVLQLCLVEVKRSLVGHHIQRTSLKPTHQAENNENH